MIPTPSNHLILAIAPGARYLGFAIFHNEELLKFGVRSFTGRKSRTTLLPEFLQWLQKISHHYRPTIVAIEDTFYVSAQLSPLLSSLIGTAKRWARKKGLKVRTCLPTGVKEHLCGDKKTRAELAQALVQRYWFLRRFSRNNKMQHYWRQAFDAIGLGLVVASNLERSAKRLKQAR